MELKNPLTNQGVKALMIVLAVIFLISTAVYLNIARQSKKGSFVLPAMTKQEEGVATEPEVVQTPTVAPPTEEPIATASPTIIESTTTD